MKRVLFALLLFGVPVFTSARVPFSEPRRTGPAAYYQRQIVGSSNGFDYLAGWTTYTRFGVHVYVQRINADGSVAPELPVALDPDSADSWGLSLTPGRDGYFASWLSESGLNVAILDSYGRVMRRNRVNATVESGAETRAAWNGAVHFVVFGKSSYDGVAFDNDANVLYEPIPLGNTRNDTSFPEVTSDSGGFLLVATKSHPAHAPYSVFYGRRVTATGSAADWFVIRSVVSLVNRFSVAWDGARDVLIWSDAFGLWMTDVDPQSNQPGASRQLQPVASFMNLVIVNGRKWISHFSENGAFVFSIGTDGVTTAPVKIDGNYGGVLLSNGSTILSVREIPAPGGDDVITQVVAPQLGPASVVATSATAQANGKLVSGGEQMLAVWDEEIDGVPQIFFNRVGSNPWPPDGPGIQLSLSGADNTEPAAAWNGREWLVVWIRSNGAEAQIVGRRVRPDGSVVDDEEILVGDVGYETTPRIASDGSNWLILWGSWLQEPGCNNFANAYRLFAVRVSVDGEVLDPAPVRVETQSSFLQTDPRLVWSGSRYIAAWTNVCYGWHTQTTSSIGAATLSSDLREIEVRQISETASTGSGTSVSSVRIVAGSEKTLIAWHHDELGQVSARLALLDNDAPRRSSRRRAVASMRAVPSVEGVLIAVDSTPSGLSVITRRTIPWAPAYQGLFETILLDDGSMPSHPLAINDPGGFFTGDVAHLGGRRWMPQARLDVREAAERMWILDF